MKNFSIINGGQTSYLIGETDFETPFYLQCKIIKNSKDDQEEKIDFIADVAEASNTQKPIKTKDLIANRKEQRMLKIQLSKANVFCSIKRGQKINKKVYTEAYQNTNNEEIGQFLFSYLYQQPGTARNNKASLTSSDDRYTLIYQKKYDSNLLIDLLKMKTFYKIWLKKVDKESMDSTKIGLAKNGMFFFAAIIGILSKIKYHEEYLTTLPSLSTSEDKVALFSQYDISHRFFKEELNLDKNSWFRLFEVCYDTVFLPGYEYLKNYKPNYTGYSNFTKTQQNYNTYILNNFLYQIKTYGLPSDIKDVLNDLFYEPTSEEKAKDLSLLKDYVNELTSNAKGKELDEAITKILADKIKAYRTKTYKALHLKAYEIMTDRQLNKIAKYGPSSIEELENLKCLNKNQIDAFGKDIIAIIEKAKKDIFM